MDDNRSSTTNRCHHFVLDLALMIFCSHYCVELKLFYFLLWSVCRERGRDFSDVLPVYNQTRQISILIYPAFGIYCTQKLLICPNCSFSRSDWAFDMGGFLRAFAATCMPVVCIVVHHQLFDPRTYRRVRLTLSASASKVGGSCWHFTSCDLVPVLVVVTTLIFHTIEWWEGFSKKIISDDPV